jgi:hypothetical protein
MAVTSLAQLRQNERLLTSRQCDNNRNRHSGNNFGFGKIALADITESISLCQSFVVWLRSQPLARVVTDSEAPRNCRRCLCWGEQTF